MSQDLTAIENQFARYVSYVGADVELAVELYTEDAVLEFPQTGERFEGRDAFTQWRAQTLAAAGDDVRFRLRRTTVRPEFSVVELFGSYDRGATWKLGCSWRTGTVTGSSANASTSWTGSRRRSGDDPVARRSPRTGQ